MFALLFPLLAKPSPAKAADGFNADGFKIEIFPIEALKSSSVKPIDLQKESLRLLKKYILAVSYKEDLYPTSMCRRSTAAEGTSDSGCSQNYDREVMVNITDSNDMNDWGIGISELPCVDACGDVVIKRNFIILPPEGYKSYNNPPLIIYYDDGPIGFHTQKQNSLQESGVIITGQSPYYTFSDIASDFKTYYYIKFQPPILVRNEDATFVLNHNRLVFSGPDGVKHTTTLPSINIKISKTDLPAPRPLQNVSDVFPASPPGASNSGSGTGSTIGGSSSNPSGSTTAATKTGNDIFSQLTNILQQLIIAAAFLMFILAIFTYVGSGGDSKKVGKAKEYLVSAITALVALVLAQWFLRF